MPGNPELLIPILEAVCVGSAALGVVAGGVIWSIRKFLWSEVDIRTEVGEEQP